MKKLIVILLATGVAVMGCEAGVGDKCSTSNECPNGTICDTDSPSGYCLAYGCESNEECPEDSVCVEFAPDITYCLKKCKKSKDCRTGYTCRDDIGDQKFCYVAPDGVYGRDEDQKVEFEAPDEADDAATTDDLPDNGDAGE